MENKQRDESATPAAMFVDAQPRAPQLLRPGRVTYRDDIDGLRAIAVLAVIANHFNNLILPGGYLGVDVFFVISGFVITASLASRGEEPLGRALVGFYARRMRRLVPALVVTVLVTAMTIRLFDPDPGKSLLTGAASVFGASNVLLYLQAIDYFGPSAKLNPFSHTWSLGVEEQFYLVFPVVLLAGHRRLNGGFRPFALLGGLTVASIVVYLTTHGSNQPAAYFLMPSRLWELGAGALVALGRTHFDQSYSRLATTSPVLPFTAMLGALLVPESFAVASTLVVVLATAWLIATVRAGTTAHSILTNRRLVYVGKISYSLYLWHWVILALSRWTIGIHLWSVPLQLSLMLTLAVGSYHWIETPVRQGRYFDHRWRTVATGLAAMLLTAAAVLVLHRLQVPRFAGNLAPDEAWRTSPVPGYRGLYSRRKIDDCFAATVFQGDAPTHERNIERCVARSNSRARVAFVGDSHAMDLFPVAEMLFHSGQASVLNVFEPGCRVPRLANEPPNCGFGSRVLRYLAAHPVENSVLVLRNNYSPKNADGSLRAFSIVLNAFLDEALGQGLRVVYFAPAPKYSSVGPGRLCSTQWFRPAWALDARCSHGYVEDRAEQLARREDFVRFLRGVAKVRPGFYVFDPFDALCGDAGPYCTPLRDGKLIHRDPSHLTEEGATLLVAPFTQFLEDRGLLKRKEYTEPAP